jgi:hypothetical protein
MKAICIQCGADKSTPYETCQQCLFDPKSNDEALVRSVYLSSGRFDSEGEGGDYDIELKAHAKRIRDGIAVDYDSSELERLRMELAEFKAFDDKAAIRFLFKFF